MNDISISYRATMASIKLAGTSGLVDLNQDDFDFLTKSTPWLAMERSRVRSCVEATVYGALDMTGIARFAVPAEFIAGAICCFVHPINYMAAAAVFEGAENTTNVLAGIDAPMSASQIFAMVINHCGGCDDKSEAHWQHAKQYLKVSQ